MRTFYESYPFAPRSGKVLSAESGKRIERYWREEKFNGSYFDIEFQIDSSGNEVSFTIGLEKR